MNDFTSPSHINAFGTPHLRIGIQALPGDYCPESGIWEWVAATPIARSPRRLITAGTLMPDLTGELDQPALGVWKLVAYANQTSSLL